MSNSGLPGRRVAAMRAGISTKVRVSFMDVLGNEGPGPIDNKQENDGD
jgi:hypothetical protein